MLVNSESMQGNKVGANTGYQDQSSQESYGDEQSLELRQEIFEQLSEFGYGDGIIKSLDNLLRCPNEYDSQVNIGAGQDLLLEFLEENDIFEAKDLARLGVGRDIRTGIRVMADFALTKNETPGPLSEYLENISIKEHGRIEREVLEAVKNLVKNNVSEAIVGHSDSPFRKAIAQSAMSHVIDGVNVKVVASKRHSSETESQPHTSPTAEEKKRRANPLNRVVKSLNVTKSWAFEQMTLMGIQYDEEARQYPSDMLERLSPLAEKIPYDDELHTLSDAVELVGKPKKWLMEQLRDAGTRLAYGYSRDTGKLGQYLTNDMIEHLRQKKAELPQPAEDMLSIGGLSRFVGRSQAWVRARIDKYNNQSQNRAGKMGHVIPHYPIFVQDILKAEVESENSYPEKGENLSLAEVAEALGKSAVKATGILQAMGKMPEPRWANKRIIDTYQQSIVRSVKRYEREQSRMKPVASSEEIYDARVIVGSLRSQIRSQQQILDELDNLGVPRSDDLRKQTTKTLRSLRGRLETAMTNLSKLAGDEI